MANPAEGERDLIKIGEPPPALDFFVLTRFAACAKYPRLAESAGRGRVSVVL